MADKSWIMNVIVVPISFGVFGIELLTFAQRLDKQVIQMKHLIINFKYFSVFSAFWDILLFVRLCPGKPQYKTETHSKNSIKLYPLLESWKRKWWIIYLTVSSLAVIEDFHVSNSGFVFEGCIKTLFLKSRILRCFLQSEGLLSL